MGRTFEFVFIIRMYFIIYGYCCNQTREKVLIIYINGMIRENPFMTIFQYLTLFGSVLMHSSFLAPLRVGYVNLWMPANTRPWCLVTCALKNRLSTRDASMRKRAFIISPSYHFQWAAYNHMSMIYNSVFPFKSPRFFVGVTSLFTEYKCLNSPLNLKFNAW